MAKAVSKADSQRIYLVRGQHCDMFFQLMMIMKTFMKINIINDTWQLGVHSDDNER